MRLTANGVEIHYEQAGEAGKNVLLLHGWGCSVKHFEQIFQDLSKDHRVTAIDFPAHGESGRPPEPWGVKDFAACVKDLKGEAAGEAYWPPRAPLWRRRGGASPEVEEALEQLRMEELMQQAEETDLQ